VAMPAQSNDAGEATRDLVEKAILISQMSRDYTCHLIRICITRWLCEAQAESLNLHSQSFRETIPELSKEFLHL